MPGAIILADQPGGAGFGSPGVARNDLWQTIPVVLSSYLGGNLSYEWELLAAPPGSAATLTTPTTSTSGFTPDLVGTYRIQLITNDGGPGNIQTLVFRCRFNAVGDLENRGWAYPAIGELAPESNYGGNTLGWAEPFETILEDIRTNFGSGGSFTPGGDLSGTSTSQTVVGLMGKAISSTPPSDGQALLWSAADSKYEPTNLGPKRVLGFGGVFTTTQTGPQTATVFPFNPGAFPSPNDRTIVFGVIGQCASVDDTLTFNLIDLTDTVTICTLTTSSTVPVELTQVLTIGTPGTNVISSSNKLYQVTVQRTGGSSSDAVTIYNAFFEVSF